jgi:hypothetical protein
VYHKAKSQADATMAQRPAAPTLRATPKPQAVRIDFAVPTDGEIHAAVHLHDAGGAPRMYDAKTGTILPAGETGQVIVFKAGAAGRSFIVVATGLKSGTFTATVCFRRPCDFDWGPTSPRSAPLVRALPPAPGAPMLEAVSDTKILVHFAVPQGCSSAAVEFYEDESSSGRSVDPQTRTLRELDGTGPPFAVTGDRIVLVESLSSEISYSVKVYAHNGIGWGPCSPASKPVKLADHQPPAPGAPVLERISADSVRVFCRLSPKCTHADILFKDVDTGVELSVDAQSANKLRGSGEGVPPPRGDCYKGIVVSGFSPDTEYEVYCQQSSNFGWSSLSPHARLPPALGGDDAPVVVPAGGGVQAAPATPAPAGARATIDASRGARDESDDVVMPVQRPWPPPPAPLPLPQLGPDQTASDGRKRAVDADDTDDDAPPPASRPIKREKKRQEHGYGLDEFCVADGHEDDDAPEELAKRRRRTVSESSEDSDIF